MQLRTNTCLQHLLASRSQSASTFKLRSSTARSPLYANPARMEFRRAPVSPSASISTLHLNEHCANEPERFLPISGVTLPKYCSYVFACFLLLSAPARTFSAVQEVRSIGLTVNDLGRELTFFTNTLPFTHTATYSLDQPTSLKLFSLSNDTATVAVLKLGSETITLTSHSLRGRPVPADSRSYDHWFQHIAIVVSDMDQAYTHLRSNHVRHVSTGPQTLPAWNKNAGGIKAFYFRDPEDHVLEIISFPAGKGDPKWQRLSTLNSAASTFSPQPSTIFLGIDHTAIVVSDTDRSLGFYRDQLGFRVVGESENYGTEQEHLNQAFGAHLRITALRADRGPGIEFLEYLTPPGGRPFPASVQPNDLLFWHTDLGLGRDALSQASDPETKIAHDPDGHALRLFSPSGAALSSLR
jgi:catechol 2,3-dioxygenase-like lactoylglutathione lyase family enzyme